MINKNEIKYKPRVYISRMVKFQIMSDLHIETLDEIPEIDTCIEPSADILILAGDIGRIHKYEQLKGFLVQLCPKFQVVLYVLGNHEYYKVDGIEVKTMKELLEDVYTIQKDIPNLHILDRSSVIVDDVCVIGCTLWTQATVNIPPFVVRIPNMNIVKYNDMFNRDLTYIETMIKYCAEKKLRLVVVSHHCPTYTISDKKDNKYRSLYCSNLDHLLDRSRVHTWICGHIHVNFDLKTRNGTRLVSNQRGKPRDSIVDFVKNKVITV